MSIITQTAQAVKRSIRRCLAGSLLAVGISGVAHAGVPVIDGGHIGAQVAEFAQQATRYAEEMKKWQEQLQNWQTQFQNWQKTFTQSQFGSLQSLINGVNIVPDGDGNNSTEMKKFIAEYNTNSRCNAISQSQDIVYRNCWARHKTEVKKMETLAQLMDYNDKMDGEIKQAIKNAEKIDGNSEAQKKAAALASVQALQGKVRQVNEDYTKTIQTFNVQIEAFNTQQAAITRKALGGQSSGGVGGVVGGVISAGVMKGAFEAIKHRRDD